MLITGMAFVLFSNHFIDTLYVFLSQRIFHRDFDLSKWLTTIQSFFLIPIFLVMMFNFVFLSKYTDKQKNGLIIGFSLAVLFSIVYCTAVTTNAHVNSDLAAELLRAKECVNQKELLPFDWYYSTELCILDTQLISSPLFLFTNNWLVVKTFTTFFSCLLLWFSCWYLLSKLQIKSAWIKLLCCTFVMLPVSPNTWYAITWGNYYVPHVTLGLFYLSFYVAMINSKQKRYSVLFYSLSFILGLTSIRYILNDLFPFLLTIIVIESTKKDRESSIYEFKEFWIKNRRVFHSFCSLIAGGIGYILNNLVLQRIFEFTNWSTITFNKLGDVKFLDIFRTIMGTLGYMEDVAVFSPSGVINILIYIGIVLVIVYTVKLFKMEIPFPQKVMLVFTILTLAFNTFVFMNSKFVPLHYCTIIGFLAPAMAVVLSNRLSDGKCFVIIAFWGTILFSSSFNNIQAQFISDENTGKYEVTKFLESKDYTFGGATFWNAGIITYFTNGRIEIQNLILEQSDGICINYTTENWLSPKRYYDNTYDDKRYFLLLENNQYEKVKNLNVIFYGKLVYSDSYYKVLEYENFKTFKDLYK